VQHESAGGQALHKLEQPTGVERSVRVSLRRVKRADAAGRAKLAGDRGLPLLHAVRDGRSRIRPQRSVDADSVSDSSGLADPASADLGRERARIHLDCTREGVDPLHILDVGFNALRRELG
jgi:hypothetical protein